MTPDQSTQEGERADQAERLCDLLARQIARARQGRMADVERLGTQADALVAAMTEDPAHPPFISAEQRGRLETLYGELALALRLEQVDVETKLKQLRQVKRAVGAYNTKKQRR